MLYCAARQVGDYVRTAEVEGHKSIWSRVLFTHTHAELADTVGISHSNEGSPVCLSLSLSRIPCLCLLGHSHKRHRARVTATYAVTATTLTAIARRRRTCG